MCICYMIYNCSSKVHRGVIILSQPLVRVIRALIARNERPVPVALVLLVRSVAVIHRIAFVMKSDRLSGKQYSIHLLDLHRGTEHLLNLNFLRFSRFSVYHTCIVVYSSEQKEKISFSTNDMKPVMRKKVVVKPTETRAIKLPMKPTSFKVEEKNLISIQVSKMKLLQCGLVKSPLMCPARTDKALIYEW